MVIRGLSISYNFAWSFDNAPRERSRRIFEMNGSQATTTGTIPAYLEMGYVYFANVSQGHSSIGTPCEDCLFDEGFVFSLGFGPS